MGLSLRTCMIGFQVQYFKDVMMLPEKTVFFPIKIKRDRKQT